MKKIQTAAIASIEITAILHIIFFKKESIDFMEAKTLEAFNLTHEQGLVVNS